MVGQHDPAGPDADRCRSASYVADHHRSCGARDSHHVVVLRQPEAAIAEAFGVLRQVQRMPQRVSRTGALGNEREIKHGQVYHSARFRFALCV